ncbi:MAG: tetratricopeptide repeat protein [Limisphaerales bacterium]
MTRPRIIALLLALGTLLVYLPVIHHEFVNYDDGGYVTENPTVKAGLTWFGVKWAFTTWVVGNWHPITMLSHMLDCQLFGLNSGMQHYVNVLFHAANTVQLFWLLLRLTQAKWPSAFVAALFAWHPLHVESVAWLAERKDVLSTFFELLALVFYERFVAYSTLRDPKAKSFYAGAVAMFALGLMSKPMLVTMPFVMLLLDFWPLERFKTQNLSPLLLDKIPFFLLTAIFCGITFWSQHGSGAVTAGANFPLYLRLENSFISYGRYLFKMFWPVNLAVIYPLSDFHRDMWLRAALMALALAAISWLAWNRRGKSPYLPTGWFWYLGTLVPVIGIVQVGGASMADRYSYFPMIGIFIMIAFGARELIQRFGLGFRGPALAAGLALAACVAFTERQLTFWQDSITLFQHAIAITHDNDIAHSNLGLALDGQGRRADALAQYQEALRISPDSAEMHNNIADLDYEMGRTNQALEEYRKSLQLKPDAGFAYINIGNIDYALHQFDDAMTNYARAAQIDRADPQTPFLIGKTYLAEGRDLDALSWFQDAWRRNPEDFNVLTYLARVLASDDNPKVRNGQIALAMAAKANDLTGGIQPVMFDTLAMAYAEIGQFDEAQRAEEYAVKLATDPKLKSDLPGMEQRLQLYKNKQPYRQSFTASSAAK